MCFDAYRGGSGVHDFFVKPDLKLNPSPLNTKNSDFFIKTKTFSCVPKCHDLKPRFS